MGKYAKILLVDDDDDLRDLLQTVLRSNCHSVVGAPDCSTAIQLLKSQDFDVVLLDITLPDAKGFEVARFLQENHLPAKVIVITATAGLENAIRSAALGVKDYITKPFTTNYLLRCIDNALSMEYPTQGLQLS